MHSEPCVILLLDPARAFAPAFRKILEPSGYFLREARTAEGAMEAARETLPNIVIKPAIERDGRTATGVMERLRALACDTEFLFVSEHADVNLAMEAIHRGAFDFLPLPCGPERLLESIRRALEHQRLSAEDPALLRRLAPPESAEAFVGGSGALREILQVVERVADTDVTVLIHGESGTGKELVARELHNRSGRSGGPFLAVNCAALADSLLESELFGHVKGAFTGAVNDKPGRFSLAAGGTLFLDEIGDLSRRGQADMLRVLEDGVFRPVGSTRTVRADVRIVAATNRDLESLCVRGEFRQDLLYRLNVITISIPPLRERTEDILPLAENFLRHFCTRHRRPSKRLSPAAKEHLLRHAWPGNVRQLRNAMERLVLLVAERTIAAGHLPAELVEKPLAADPSRVSDSAGVVVDDTLTLAELEEKMIRRVLERCGGNIAEAARRLGIGRRTLHYRLATFRSRAEEGAFIPPPPE